jgi:uncharacterized membrane protein YedE/YeeE
MPSSLVPILSGLLFGAGLALSGMTNPVRVQGFLDVAGRWDPTLAFVMGGALGVTILGPFALRRVKALASAAVSTGPQAPVDAPLVVGSAIFGIGWGAAGFCPGPSVANLATGDLRVVLFVAAMAGGVLLHRLYLGFVTRSEDEVETMLVTEDG